jgi:hypothetical protein
MKKIHFFAGLPRTGSSVLSSILNQHPQIQSNESRMNFVLRDLDMSLFQNCSKVQDINTYLGQRKNTIQGFIEGFYKDYKKEIILDKNLQWNVDYKDVHRVGLEDSKIILTIRPLEDIVASYVSLILKNPLKNSVDETLKERGYDITNENRALFIWEETIKDYFKSMVEIMHFTPVDRMCIVNYNELVENPKQVLDRICNFLDVEKYDFDLMNIQSNQNVYEHNEILKYLPGLHDVEKELKKENIDALKVLGHEMLEYFQETDKKKQHFLDEALNQSLMGNFEESEKLMTKYSFTRNDNRVIFNTGLFEMIRGNMNEAFKRFNAGRLVNSFGDGMIPGEIWNGQDLKGKKLLLRLEGGLGDEIINFRFFKDFEKLGADVVVACHPSLAGLFRQQGARVIYLDDIPQVQGMYDYWVPAMSAAQLLGYEIGDISGKPYIDFPSRNLPCKPNKLKVGIRWAGNPQFEHQQFRKFNPTPLINLHKIEGTSFYSLQRDVDVIDDLPFYDLRDEMQRWEDTASIIKKLDLVITSCTSVAHLAGAMGVPTWIIVPKLPYYIWAHDINGTTSPWYDSVKLYRQQTFGEWDSEFQRIGNDLIDLVKEKNKK